MSSGRKPPTPENVWIKWLYDRKVNFGLKKAFGIFAVILSAATRRVLDCRVEAVLVDASPLWLTDLNTRFSG